MAEKARKFLKDPLAAKQAKYGATATLYTLVVLVILVLINWLGYRYNKSIDTTSNKRFTLSQETQKVIKNLKTNATIYYFDKASNFEQAKGILDGIRICRQRSRSSISTIRRSRRLPEPLGCAIRGRRMWKLAPGVKKRKHWMSRV